jgi:hypothetical protein
VIYYFAPDNPVPSGGVRQCYRHVEALRKGGIEAFVLHQTPNFRASWFSSPAPIAYLEESLWKRFANALFPRRLAARLVDQSAQVLRGALIGTPVRCVGPDGKSERRFLSEQDVLVVPEYPGAMLRAPQGCVPTVVFNQGPHLTFLGYPLDTTTKTSIYRDPIRGVITVSHHGLRYLNFAFPGLPVWRTPNSVDPAIFHLGGEKRRRIAFMPRKLSRDIQQVISMLKFRGSLNGWELCPIDRRSERETADLLRGSAIFLCTLEQEGFGLPPLEAALCGCLVVGYTGFAAGEFMSPDWCYPVPERSVLDFVATIEKVMAAFDADPAPLLERAQRQSAKLAAQYSFERQAKHVVETWHTILGSTPALAPNAASESEAAVHDVSVQSSVGSS